MPGGVTRTVRLDEELDLALRNRAKDERVTVNSLVNRAIWKFIEWDLPSEKIGMVDVSPVTVGKLMNEIDDERLVELGRQIAGEVVKPFTEYLYGEFSVDSSILFFKRMSHYAGRGVFGDKTVNGKHVLVIKHNLGQKWSRYSGGVFEGVFGDLLGKKTKVNYTDDLCMVQFPAD